MGAELGLAVPRKPGHAGHAGSGDGEVRAPLVELGVEHLVDRTLGPGLLPPQPGGAGAEHGGLPDLLLDEELGQALAHRRIGPVGDAVDECAPGILAGPSEDRRRVEGYAGDGVALVGQRGAGAAPPVANLTDPILVGDAHVGEEHLVELSRPRHLAQGPDLDPGARHVEDEVGEAVVLVHGAGGERRQVGTGSRLAEQLAPPLLAAEDLAQVALLLGVGAVADDRGPAQADAQDVGAEQGKPVAAQLLPHQLLHPGLPRETPVLLGPERRAVAALADRAHPGEDVPALGLGGRAHLAVGLLVGLVDGLQPSGMERLAQPAAEVLPQRGSLGAVLDLPPHPATP